MCRFNPPAAARQRLHMLHRLTPGIHIAVPDRRTADASHEPVWKEQVRRSRSNPLFLGASHDQQQKEDSCASQSSV